MPCNPGIPAELQAGDVIQFDVTLNGYDSSLYDAKFMLTDFETSYAYLHNTAVGSVYSFAISSPVSAGWKPGKYQSSVALYKKSDNGRLVYYIGTAVVRPDPAATSGLGKSKWRTVLEKCDEAILGLAGSTNASYAIEGQMWTKRNLSELMKFRNEVEAKMNAEEAAAGLSLVQGGIKKIRTRFVQ